jgi:transcriptional regulator with XRE-family HTH domain
MGNPGNTAGWFGSRLTELRTRAGLTPEQLAQKAGLTLGAFAQLERGERSPAWGTMVTLAKALGVGVEVFAEERVEEPRTRRGRPRRPGGDQAGRPPSERD